MKLVALTVVALLVSLSACGDPAGAPPQVEAKAADTRTYAEAKIAEAKAAEGKGVTEAKVPETKAPEAKAADGVAEAKAADGVAEAKAADGVAEATPPVAGPAVAADAKAPPGAGAGGAGFYWANAAKGARRAVIDVTDTSGEEVEQLMAANEGADGIEGMLPPTAKLPPGFAVGDKWAVATTAGARRGKTIGFGAYTGASESHFIVVIDTVAEGLAARPGRWPGPVPTLSKARRVDTRSGPGLDLIERIKEPIAATGEPAARRALGRKPIANKHLTVFEGRFPRGFTHLVALVRPLARADEVGTEHVGGLLLVDATGKAEAIIAPKLTIDSQEVLYLVDLEGDGIDEVVFDSSYYEGSYRMLLTWDAAQKPVLHTLGGDGA